MWRKIKFSFSWTVSWQTAEGSNSHTSAAQHEIRLSYLLILSAAVAPGARPSPLRIMSSPAGAWRWSAAGSTYPGSWRLLWPPARCRPPRSGATRRPAGPGGSAGPSGDPWRWQPPKNTKGGGRFWIKINTFWKIKELNACQPAELVCEVVMWKSGRFPVT